VVRSRRDLQVALYALGAASALHLEPLQLEVIYLASGETLRLERPEALVAEAQKQGSEVAEGARAGRFEARPERRRCRLCPYRLACAEAL
jgi:CRISPR/Cas system-associated exonuclease Cas4 (RecB family)